MAILFPISFFNRDFKVGFCTARSASYATSARISPVSMYGSLAGVFLILQILRSASLKRSFLTRQRGVYV